MKRTSFALLLAVASLLFSSMAVGAYSSSALASKAQKPVLADDPAPIELTIHGTDDEFAPQTLTVDSGVVYHLTLVNDDTDEHDWEVDGVGLTKSCVGPCQQDVTFTAPAPGTYKFYCIVHSDMGGTLFVK